MADPRRDVGERPCSGDLTAVIEHALAKLARPDQFRNVMCSGLRLDPTQAWGSAGRVPHPRVARQALAHRLRPSSSAFVAEGPRLRFRPSTHLELGSVLSAMAAETSSQSADPRGARSNAKCVPTEHRARGIEIKDSDIPTRVVHRGLKLEPIGKTFPGQAPSRGQAPVPAKLPAQWTALKNGPRDWIKPELSNR